MEDANRQIAELKEEVLEKEAEIKEAKNAA